MFRADASVRMGNGHIMRCLSLAEKLREMDCGVWFACRNWPGNAGGVVQQRGFEVLWIDAVVGAGRKSDAQTNSGFDIPVEQDATECRVLVGKTEIDWLIVDHYGIDAGWHGMMRDRVGRIMVIDDLADRKYDCDLLLDQTYGRTDEAYVGRVPDDCDLLLGAEYALLRPEFARLRFAALDQRHDRTGVARILVSTGGSDPDNLSSQILDGLNCVDWGNPPQVDLILGPGFQHGDELRRIAKNHVARVDVVENVSNMAEYMRDADLAIGAGGSTAWERCCLGLPALTLQLADNQALVVSNLLAAGAIAKLPIEEALSEAVARQVSEYLNEPGRLDVMSAAAAGITRGLGADLVASRLVPKFAKDGHAVALRPADAGDMETVHAWQSHENTRRFSQNRQPPALEEHKRWYHEKLHDPGGYFFIIMHGGNDAGVLRLDRIDEVRPQLLISIYTAPGHYRQGLARCALEYAIGMFSHADLVANVLPDNKASKCLFSGLGFEQIAEDRYIYAATSSR